MLLLCLILAAGFLLPVAAEAQETEKTVRVGWYESSYNSVDVYGRRSGYAYDYQLKLGAYAGWKYEYVSGSWSVLLQMLENGEIDLMSDVSYMPEREEYMLYPDLPMGTEEYFIFQSGQPRNIIVRLFHSERQAYRRQQGQHTGGPVPGLG